MIINVSGRKTTPDGETATITTMRGELLADLASELTCGSRETKISALYRDGDTTEYSVTVAGYSMSILVRILQAIENGYRDQFHHLRDEFQSEAKKVSFAPMRDDD
jgi:hypothetical protein